MHAEVATAAKFKRHFLAFSQHQNVNCEREFSRVINYSVRPFGEGVRAAKGEICDF
jgi:hypothetical protein